MLYLDRYGVLPDNYITKDEARALGWEGGSVENYLDGAAIGGDRFGNREGLLPKAAAAATPNVTSTRTANRAAAQSGWSFRTTASIFTPRITMKTFDELVVTETQEVAWK